MPTSKFSPDTLKSQILPEGGLATNERYQVIFSGDVVNRIDPDSKTNQRFSENYARGDGIHLMVNVL